MVPTHRLSGALLLALGLLAPAVRAADPAVPAAVQRGKEFFKALATECAVPEGATAFGLLSEAVEMLGSPDSEWRDDIGYGVVARCAYAKRALDHEERRQLVERLSANLRRGIGSSSDDSVLLRSFSALDLSVLAAIENDDPALDEAGFRRLFDAALAYLADELDARGFEPRVGWIHATAHTADLLKFLARNPRFTSRDQIRLLDAVEARLIRPGQTVFVRAEDERLAAAIVSVISRDDFDPALLDPWIGRFVAREAELWAVPPPDVARLDAAQNGRNLLRSLYVLLALPSRAPASPARDAARDKLLGALGHMRR